MNRGHKDGNERTAAFTHCSREAMEPLKNLKLKRFQRVVLLSSSFKNFLRTRVATRRRENTIIFQRARYFRVAYYFLPAEDCSYNIFSDALAACKIHACYANPFHPLRDSYIYVLAIYIFAIRIYARSRISSFKSREDVNRLDDGGSDGIQFNGSAFNDSIIATR